jgi:predicted ATP-dependent endonuclease of OLD family
MKLTNVNIQKFRNIINSDRVEIQPSVTCLVGKNESGKTAFLEALYQLNPARSNVDFSLQKHYPAWLEKQDRHSGINLNEVIPVSAEFTLDKTDKDLLISRFGAEVLVEDKFVLSRSYGNSLKYHFESTEKFVVQDILREALVKENEEIQTIDELKKYAEQILENPEAGNENQSIAKKIKSELESRLKGKDLKEAIFETLEPHIPKFFYFSEYSKLPYSVSINKITKTDIKKLNESELTARALLKFGEAEDSYLISDDYERRKREIENIANSLTSEVLEFWSQNPELRVNPDIDLVKDTSNKIIDRELKIRIWDNRHFLSLPFNEHSTGFQWFFSFLASFSEFENKSETVIILLDEPALGLHAKAQYDFLRFIEERLSKSHQVIYTTHSPFMIVPDKLERVRLVEDKGKETGAKITDDVTLTDSDTLFPLQGALGYDLAQNLFINKHNIIVEGTSDYTYLQVISDFFSTNGKRTYLDEKWSIVPVGGIDLIPTFVALLGNHLDVTVLIDSQKGGNQKLDKLIHHKILKTKRIIDIGSIIDQEIANIEDLFEAEEYLCLYNNTYGTKIRFSQLKGSDSIVQKIARADNKQAFNHGRPADWFLRNRDRILPKLSDKTLDRFETLFKSINETIDK